MPTYQPQQFEHIAPPKEDGPFRVLYAGRVEHEKGVFNLLDMASRFVSEGRTYLEVHVCGSGGALEELIEAAQSRGLTEQFHCHGHLGKEGMREMFERSHVVVVPTTSEFDEGFNKVVAEGILSGRPVVTSAACPALSYVRSAVVEVPVDDLQAYGDAILELWDNADFYKQKRDSCSVLQGQFYDEANGWAAALKRSLSA